MKRRGAFLIMCSLLLGNAAQAYIMLPALPLEEVAAQADLVFKGTAISSKSCNHDGAIGDVETRFRVISVIKGEYSSARLGFVHSDRLPPTPVFDPRLHYHFEIGRTYLVFAKGTGDPRVFQQLWINQTGKMDQGVLLCANDKTVSAPAIKPAFWSELISMLHSGRPNDVIYALWQLDQMTGGPGNGRVRSIYSDFGRQQIWAAAHEFITNPNPEIAKMAIGLIGAHNPYMHTADPGEDLAGISATWPVSLTGFTLTLWDLTPLDKWPGNPGALLYRNELTAVANGRMDNATRALAIRALGLVRDRALETPLARWLTDPAPAVRSAAALLLADYPDLATRDRVMTLARDPEPSVRESTGFLIGYGQQNDKADMLAKLLTDPDAKVRRAAGASLLLFPAKDEAIAAIFRANLKNQEIGPLCLIALARENPEGYLDGLAGELEQQTMPTNWPGGENPTFSAWNILFGYLRDQPFTAITSGKFDRYLDVMEKGRYVSSSEPRDLYAFYILRGMTARALRFRQEADKAAGYDLDFYFRQVDRNPSLYERRNNH